MPGEADEGQFLSSYRAGVLGPSGLVRSSASQSSCINVLVVLVARTAVPPLCQAVRCTFNPW